VQKIKEFGPDGKSAGFPKIFQRSDLSFLLAAEPLALLVLRRKFLSPVSLIVQGWALWMLTIELSFHPSSNWP